VEVVAPFGVATGGPDGIIAFVEAKRDWIHKAVRRIDEHRGAGLKQRYIDGARLLYRGRRVPLHIVASDVPRVQVAFDCCFRLLVPDALNERERELAAREALHEWMRERAIEDAVDLVQTYAAALGVRPTAVRLSTARTRWGSCNSKGAIRINWRLVQAPREVMEYVAAHEVAHILVPNHSRRFWDTVASIMPDFRDRKSQLRRWEREQLIEGRDL
jgi:predicted metal-dependent hydrolase